MAVRHTLGSTALALLLAAPAAAQDRAITYNNFGVPGLLEMPSAMSADDGEIAGTLSYFGGQLRTSFTVQVTPRFSGTFRYSGIRDFWEPGVQEETTLWDRSFDLRYRLTDEGPVMPAVAVGLQDFLGTGVYSGEYVVATKTVGSAVRVTAGLGWGRLGSYNGFSNPLSFLGDAFEEREVEVGLGGVPRAEGFFQGDAALFGGVEWAPTERWILKAEYSSDDGYEDSVGDPLFERRSPLSFGAVWRPRPGIQVGMGYLYGSQLSFGATVTVNPNNRPYGGGLDPAPVPVAVRDLSRPDLAGWDRAAQPEAALRDRLALALRAEGIELVGVELTDRAARLRYVNGRYRSDAQAMGRIVRVLSEALPPSIETFTLEPSRNGIPLSAVSFARTDVETLENEVGGTVASRQRAVFADAGPDAGLVRLPPVRDRFSWRLRPVVGLYLFDVDKPVALTFGAELSASYSLRPNLVLSGALRQSVFDSEGNFLVGRDALGDEAEPVEPIGDVPVVRRDSGRFTANGLPSLSRLTLAWFTRPGENLYGRVTAGYLERMYAGVSTELLWKPVTSPLGLGVELNYVRKRDYEDQFGLQDYAILTGHASAYYDLGNGFHGQVDVGRYLAGDWGATVTLDREFDNGWRVGGYFTLTDIPFEDFGEGSFDKGIRLTIPIDFVTGRPTRGERGVTLSSLTRDGGARVSVDGRLYDVVRGAHYGDLEDSWGRFWR